MSAHAESPIFLEPRNARFTVELRDALDRLVALALLIWLTPVLIIIAVAVWAESGGPIFFSQMRLGKRGRQFPLRKFRKFHAQQKQTGLAVTLRNDPRMTRIGWVLELYEARRIAAALERPGRRNGDRRSATGIPELRRLLRG